MINEHPCGCLSETKKLPEVNIFGGIFRRTCRYRDSEGKNRGCPTAVVNAAERAVIATRVYNGE